MAIILTANKFSLSETPVQNVHSCASFGYFNFLYCSLTSIGFNIFKLLLTLNSMSNKGKILKHLTLAYDVTGTVGPFFSIEFLTINRIFEFRSEYLCLF